MKNSFTVLFFLYLSVTFVAAQTTLRQATSKFGKKQELVIGNEIDRIFNPKKLLNPKKRDLSEGNISPKVYSSDTIYSSRTKKQHGWMAPMDTISKEMASHRNCSFRFTMKNQFGNWEKMEAVDGYGKYVKGTHSPYILKIGTASNSDRGANGDWVERLNTTCIYEFISDLTGRNVVQEVAYDENNNVIYTFSHVSIGNNQYIGSYRDNHGLPAEMRKDENYSYGTLIKITEDQWGNDSVMQFIDSKGMPKLNSDSVAMEVYICDSLGHLLKQQSVNVDGSLTIDNWGNCGIEYEWNNKHQITSATYMDDHWHPMRMPSKRERTGRENIVKASYLYDEYLRQKSEFFSDENDKQTENCLGTHKIESEYDDKGNLLKQIGYSIDGKLSAISESNNAIEQYVYDKDGRIIEAFFLDKDGKPCSTEGYLSKIVFGYDQYGNEILKEQYYVKEGKENIYYQYRREKLFEYVQWSDGSSRVDSLDNKGRLLFRGFYDKNGNYEMVEGRAYEKYYYVDKGKKTHITKIDYDAQDKEAAVNGICRTITLTDSINWTKTIWRYCLNGELKECLIQRFSPGFIDVLGQDDSNVYGIVARSGGASNVRYYKGNVMYDHKKENIVSIYGRDEFGEPDYITSNNKTYYYQKSFPHSSTRFYDVNNNIIENVDQFKDSLPKVMTIEIIDSSAYRLGIKDNDIILLYGDYSVNLDTIVSYSQFKEDWSLRSVVDANKIKRMVVFRITDAANNQYGLYEISSLCGNCSDLGFITHIRYLTATQLARIKKTIEENFESSNPIVDYASFKKPNNQGGKNYVIFAYTEMYRENRDMPYPKYITDPSILLGSCTAERKMKWTFKDGENTDSFTDMLLARDVNSKSYPIQHFFLTKDAKNITQLELSEWAVNTNWSDCYISDEDYIALKNLYIGADNKVDSIISVTSSSYRNKLIGNWRTDISDVNEKSQIVHFEFKKDGTFTGFIENYGYREFSDAVAWFEKDRYYSGNWTNGGKWLFFYPESADSLLTCIDATGLNSEEDRVRAVSLVNSVCQNDINYSAQVTMLTPDIHGDFFISCVKKNKISLISSSGDTIHLIKTTDIPRTINKKISNDLSKKNDWQIDESSPLIGCWECEIPEIDNSTFELRLNKDGVLNLCCSVSFTEVVNDTSSIDFIVDVNISGNWCPYENGFKTDLDPESLVIDYDYICNKVDKENEMELIRSFNESFEPQKTEFGLSLINGLDSEFVVAEVDSIKMVMEGRILTKSPEKQPVIVGQIEEEGYLAEKGLSGLYIILEFCDWTISKPISEFNTIFENNVDKAKKLILLPVDIVNNEDVFGDIIEIDVPEIKAGMGIKDVEISKKYYRKNIFIPYNNYKKQMKQ